MIKSEALKLAIKAVEKQEGVMSNAADALLGIYKECREEEKRDIPQACPTCGNTQRVNDTERTVT